MSTLAATTPTSSVTHAVPVSVNVQSVIMGQGDGPFSGGSKMGVVGSIKGVVLGDLKADGILDLGPITASRFASTPSVWHVDEVGVGTDEGLEVAVETNVTAAAAGRLDGEGVLMPPGMPNPEAVGPLQVDMSLSRPRPARSGPVRGCYRPQRRRVPQQERTSPLFSHEPRQRAAT